MAAKALETAEAARLAECERVIEAGVETFMAVGEALTEIRDAKLYRETHRTFDAYHQERWGIGKSRAYQLIDHAKAVAAISEATGEKSTVVEVSERETRAIKADLPAVVEDIKTRVASGEKPAAAAKNAIEAKRNEHGEEKRKADAKRIADAADRAEKQAKAERERLEHREKLPAFVAELDAAKEARRGARPLPGSGDDDTDALEATLAELRETNAALEADIAAVRAENDTYSDMKVEYAKGGYEEVVAGLKQQIAVLGQQVETESADKVSWMRSARLWQKRAKEAGWSDEEVIDLREAING